jgi:ATP-binding cassette subfamily F protein 3
MITLQSVSKQFGAKIIFNKISIAFNPTHRIGLIGPNGAGKTLLMRMLVGQESPDSGSVALPGDLRIGYLPQEIGFERDETPLEYMLRPFAHVMNHEESAARLSASADSPAYRQAVRDFERMQRDAAVHDIFSLAPRSKTILSGLGVPEASWDQDIRRLSGGYQARVALAQLLLLAPDFLLLDEPTNHLDMDSLIWLEKFLQRFNGGLLVISHDRDFLTRITTHTAELLNATLTQYTGNLEAYFAWKSDHVATEQRRQKNIEDKIADTRAFIERFKAKNTKATQAKSKMKQLERLEQELPDLPRQSVDTMRFRLPDPPRCGAVPLALRGVGAGYGDTRVFENIELTVTRGDKVAIIGPNGAGKSTLLKVCASVIPAISGSVEKGANTEIRYFSQHRLDQLQPHLTLYDTIAQAANSTRREQVMNILGAFLFSGDDAQKTVSVLSGGEKSRLSLASILANPGNVLLLDEPTNHLDIQSIERLTEALAEYEGTLLIVSHDEYFISRIATRVVEMRPGSMREFPGSPAEYRSYIEAGFIASVDEKASSNRPEDTDDKNRDKEDRIRKREERKKLERRIDKIENTIAETESSLAELDKKLHDPCHARDYLLLQETTEAIASTRLRHDEHMSEWSALSEELERMGPREG